MEQNEQLSQIENKLNIILAAMSVHPEFGDLVKQGKRELYKAQKSEELRKRMQHWENYKVQGVVAFLQTYEGKNSSLYYELMNIQNGMRPGMLYRAPARTQEEQRQAILSAIENLEAHSELAKYLYINVGRPVDFDKELNLIMEEYDRKQETRAENV